MREQIGQSIDGRSIACSLRGLAKENEIMREKNKRKKRE
jgi:hypothetical protein